MKTTISVLAALGNPSEFEGIVEWIRRRKHTVNIVMTGGEALRIHHDTGADLVLVGLPLPDQKAGTLLNALREQDPRVGVVVVGSDDDIGSAVDAFDLGVQDYVANPIDDKNDLLFALGLALGVRTGDVQLRFLRNKDAAGADWRAVVGESPAMQKVVSTLRHICERTSGGAVPIVLLTGETGTGKGVIAKSLHYNSARRNRAFVDLNCAAISSNLLESELFGHEKGAFTDARSTRIGLFETANGGTLFLDEIGAMQLDLQSKILTAIEERKIRRVGGNQAIRVDVQIIAATHADLAAMAKRNQFRVDLYHRLNVIAIELPPLRDRGNDVIQIAETMIAALSADYGIAPPRLAEDARAALRDYAWPGNVRELRNELERVLLLVDEETIRAEHFRFTSGRADRHGTDSVAITASDEGLEVVLTGDRCPLDELEREVIRQALRRCRGNVSRAGRFLGISRQTLIYRLRKHGFQTATTPGLDEDEESA